MKQKIKNYLKTIWIILFCALLIIWSIFLPWYSYNMGKTCSENTEYTPYVLLSLLGVTMICGWCILFRFFLVDSKYWYFDLGCGWGVYLQTEHYRDIGNNINSEMCENNVLIFDRAKTLLNLYYINNKYVKPFDVPHGQAVSIIETSRMSFDQDDIVDNNTKK